MQPAILDRRKQETPGPRAESVLTTAIDLSTQASLERTAQRDAEVERERALAEKRERLERRINWLERKAARLPLNSNGRRKAQRDADACRALLGAL